MGCFVSRILKCIIVGKRNSIQCAIYKITDKDRKTKWEKISAKDNLFRTLWIVYFFVMSSEYLVSCLLWYSELRLLDRGVGIVSKSLLWSTVLCTVRFREYNL